MSYPHLTTPAPDAETAARRPADDTRRHLAQRIREVQLGIIDACARLVDQLARKDETSALALADQRRQFANMLHASAVCHRRACRRTQSCQGEPSQCLAVLLPAIGFDRPADLLAPRKKVQRERA